MKGLTGIYMGKACAVYWHGAVLLIFLWFSVGIITASSYLCDVEAEKIYSVTGEKVFHKFDLITFNTFLDICTFTHMHKHAHTHMLFNSHRFFCLIVRELRPMEVSGGKHVGITVCSLSAHTHMRVSVKHRCQCPSCTNSSSELTCLS